VLRHVETNGMQGQVEERRKALAGIAKPSVEDFLRVTDQQTLDLVASFQHAVVEDLVGKTLAAALEWGVETLLVSGGVAANSRLRERFVERATKEGVPVYFPSLRLSTDNAAMIAAAAYPKFLGGQFANEELSAEASFPLG
jgi:N6-L-threonylcarbamoyladenine synthase